MTAPVPKLEIAPGIDATAEPGGGDWVDVSSRLRGFNVDRGRQEQLDQVESGTATFTLDNRDRALDPDNEVGLYYPNVRPMMHIRFTEGGSSGKVFRGFVDTWKQSWPGMPLIQSDAIVTVPCTDAFKVLANRKTAKSVWEREIHKLVAAGSVKAWFRLNDPAGTVAPLDSGPSAFKAAVAGNVAFAQAGLLPFGAPSETSAAFAGTPTPGVPNDYISVEPRAAITTANWTIEVVIQPDADAASSASANQSPISMTSADRTDYILLEYDTRAGFYRAKLTVNAGAGFAQVLPAVLTFAPDGKPHHLMAKRTWNGATGSISLWLDGALLGTAALNVATAPALPTCIIGNINPGAAGDEAWGNNNTGLLQEVLWYENTTESAVTHAGWALTPGAEQDAGALITAALDDISFTAALRDIGTGRTKMQPHALDGSVLEYATRLTDTEDGLLYVAADGKLTFRSRDYLMTPPLNTSAVTFGDGGGSEVPYQELELDPGDEHIRNEARVGRKDAAVVVVGDATSQDKYFTRTTDHTELLTDSDEEVRQRGHWLVSRFKDPRTTVTSLTVALADERVDRNALLALELGQVVTVKRRPPGGGTITKTARVEGFHHEGARDLTSWRVTLWLSGWDPAVDQPLIWDDATYSKWDQNVWG